MLRKVLKAIGLVVLVLLVALGVFAWRNWDTLQRVAFGGLHVHESIPPELPADLPRPAFLVFSKTNAFRHVEAIPAANALFAEVARQKGWGVFETENGAAFTPQILSRFDAVVFSNTSGDVFDAGQQAALQTFLEHGGGFVGIHAAGDNSHAGWRWYMDSILGTTFTGHPMHPQFQEALVTTEDAGHPVTQGLPASWRRTDEWYSFDRSPRATGAHVLVTIDEKTYKQVGLLGGNLSMGDHPMVWTRCIGPAGGKQGRMVYSAFGHTAASYAEPEHRQLLVNALAWAMRQAGTECDPPAAAGGTR